MTVVREVDHGVNWAEQRQRTDEQLMQLMDRVEIAESIEHPDPETWGLEPAQIAAQERAMRLGGAGGAEAGPPA